MHPFRRYLKTSLFDIVNQRKIKSTSRSQQALGTLLILFATCLSFGPGASAQLTAPLKAEKLLSKTCPVIPRPLYATRVAAGKNFTLTPRTKITLAGTLNKELAVYFWGRLAAFLGENWAGGHLDQMSNGRSSSATSRIILTVTNADATTKNALLNKNGYQLDMQPGVINIRAATDQGLFLGLNSLLQLALQPDNLPAGDKDQSTVTIDCWKIQDQPALAWRGFMLDESRHFFGMEKVKELLDWMAFYKLNRFHWHLTDSPGWRMSINAYPKLTTVGGIGNKTDPDAPARFYTQAEIREIIAYARRRFIQVIPEVDMPGHATSANRAYPEMSGGGTGKYANFTFNPGKKEVYGFLTKILEETATLFPVHVIHLGGDEVSFGSASWKTDPAVQGLMKRAHLKDIKAVEYYFLRKMADSALKYNRRILAWDEAVDAKLPINKTTITWWRHDKTKQLGKALSAGYSVIFCPRLPFYFDFVQDSSHAVGRRWGKQFVDLKRVFDFWPADVVPKGTNYKPGQIWGVQANLWSEKVETTDRLEFLVFPRMAALAVAGWTPPERRSFPDFLGHLKAQFPLYQKADIYYFNYFDPPASPEPKK